MPTPFDHYRGAILHRSEWRARGVHQRRLSSPDFMRIFPGYYALASPPPLFTAMASVLQRYVVPGAILSHTTAALQWGMPLPSRLENGVGLLSEGARFAEGGSLCIPSVRSEPGEDDVFRPAPAEGAPRAAPSRAPRPSHQQAPHQQAPHRLAPAARRRVPRLPLLHCRVGRSGPSGVGAHENVAVHRSDIDVPIARVGGLDLTSPLRTLLDLATMVPVWDLVAAIDAVISGETLVSGVALHDVQDFADQMAGKRGAGGLRRAARSARADVRSPGETMARLLVVEAGFDEPIPNLGVIDPRTGARRLIDNGWSAPKVGLDYDGDGHRTRRGQWQDNEARRDELASYGWHLARMTTRDVHRPARFLHRLTRTMRERGARAPSTEHIDAVVARLHGRRPSLWIDPAPGA